MEEKNNELPENKEEQKEVKKNITERVRENPWMLSTLVLGVVMIIFIGTFSFRFGVTGMSISEKVAGEKIVDFVKTQTGKDAEVVEVNKQSGLYEVVVLYEGKEIPVYLTLDGESLVQGITPLSILNSEDEEPELVDVPKSDKPKVELYVFTYCPYGLQFEKAIIPVVNLLKDKIEFKIRQIGAMHGEYEKLEAERQLCIEKLYSDKFLNYINEFALSTDVGSCSGDATCLVSKLNSLYSKLGIDSSKINSCMSSEGESLYNAELSNSQSKGISGSPTLVINGVETQSSRNSEAIKELICSAFNDAPSECSQTLSTNQVSAGFGSGTSSSGNANAQC